MGIRRAGLILFLWGSLATGHALAGDVVVIAHPSVPRLDSVTVERIYTGKIVEVGGVRVTPLDLVAGHPLRGRFLARWLDRDEERYSAYWTVRRYVGKGVPPSAVPTAAEMIRLVSGMPGAVGYVDEADVKADVKAGVNVLVR